ncbi:MAG: BON domain-containing protein [Thiomonas sp.]|jgi:hypothetical protein
MTPQSLRHSPPAGARHVYPVCAAPLTADAAVIDTAADEHLLRLVRKRLSQTALRHLRIDVQVRAGLVRLCGQLRDPRLRAHAEWLVFTTPGVHAVCSDWHASTTTAGATRAPRLN